VECIIQVERNFKVYIHTNLITNKKYVGITKTNLKTNWTDELSYKDNKKFYSDIQKYGWDNFKHKILYDNLNYLQARTIESNLIKNYDLIKNGYNQSLSERTEFTSFDFYNFATLDTKDSHYVNNTDYFAKIPNIFIQTNICKMYGLHKVFLVVYILIDRNRNYENKSYISIGQVFDFCGYKKHRNKPKIFYEIIKSILFLTENKFIETNFDYSSIGYDDCIQIKIISDNFEPKENFTKITGESIDTIMMTDTSLNRENIISVFLYINSYIGCRKKHNDGSELKNAKDYPEAFWKSVNNMAKDLSISKEKIIKCMEYLTSSTNNRNALLIKRDVGSIQPDKTKPPKNVPNIYVLNKKGYQQEIKWALDKMLKIYNVDNFYSAQNENDELKK
jgi:hypothetical protein